MFRIGEFAKLSGLTIDTLYHYESSFSTIGKTIEGLMEWIKQNGYKKAGPMREIYHKGDWVTSDENEYVTEIQIPIE